MARGQQNIPLWRSDHRGTPEKGGTASRAGSQRPERVNVHPSRGRGLGPLLRQDQQGQWITDTALPTSQGSVHSDEGGKLPGALEPLVPPVSHVGTCLCGMEMDGCQPRGSGGNLPTHLLNMSFGGCWGEGTRVRGQRERKHRPWVLAGSLATVLAWTAQPSAPITGACLTLVVS